MLVKIKEDIKMVEKTFIALGTINHIKTFGDQENVVKAAIDRVLEIDDRMSAFKPDSDISKLNNYAGYRYHKIHADTFHLIQKAVEFSKLSNGAFDISIRPLVGLWGINKKRNFIPSDLEVQKALDLINYKDICIHSKSHSVMLKRTGQAVDLGGIAKGFAADEVRRVLISGGVKSAMINLGGNIITIGKRPDGRPWQVGIQNPLAPTGQFLGILSIANKTVVTSGSNERFFIKDGVRYHHILDPRIGKPVQNSLLSVTAICSSSTDADALTTALFILGPDKGLPLLRKFKAEAIFVDEDLTVTVSEGLVHQFEPI